MRAHGFMAINKIKKNRVIYRFNMYEKIKTSLFLNRLIPDLRGKSFFLEKVKSSHRKVKS